MFLLPIILAGCNKFNDMDIQQLYRDSFADKNRDSVVLSVYNPSPDETLTAKLFSNNDLVNQNNFVRTGSIINTSTVVNGDALPDNTVTSIYDDTNYLFATTISGLWIYTKATNTGQVINTGTIVNGDALPSNYLRKVVYDYANKRLIIACNADYLWIYDMITNTGTSVNIKTLIGSVPSILLASIFYENNIVYIAIGSVSKPIAIYNINLGTCTSITPSTVVIGDNCPNNSATDIFFVNNILYTTFAGVSGLWVYEINTNIAKVYNSTTSVNGQAMPYANTWGVYYVNGKIYVSMGSFGSWNGGVWILNYSTNYAYTITNSSTFINGDLPPIATYVRIYYKYGYLYVGTTVGLYELNLSSYKGILYNTSSNVNGYPPPNDYMTSINVNRAIYGAPANSGIWKYSLPFTKPVITSNGVSYDEIVNDFLAAPVNISDISLIFESTNSEQSMELLKLVYQSPNGKINSKYIHPHDAYNFNNPDRVFKLNKVNWKIDAFQWFEYDILPNTTVRMVFKYNQMADTTDLLYDTLDKINASLHNNNTDTDNSKFIGDSQKSYIFENKNNINIDKKIIISTLILGTGAFILFKILK